MPTHRSKPREVMLPTAATSVAAERRRLLAVVEEQPVDGHAFCLRNGEKRYLKYQGCPLEVIHAISLLSESLNCEQDTSVSCKASQKASKTKKGQDSV